MDEGLLLRGERLFARIALAAGQPYRDLGLSSEVLAELEHLLRLALENHPTPQHLLRVLADEPMVAHSDTVNVSSLGEDRKKGESA